MLIHVNSAPDIRSALKIANEYNLDIILVGAKEAWRVAVDIAAANVPVILNPTDNLPSGFEAMAATLSNAERLAAAGVTIAFYDSGIGYTHNTRSLPQLAGIAVANGLDYDTAIAAITANPAKIWGLGDKMGTLARGKRADIVVWNGDPLELASRPIAVIIDGKLSDLDNRQAALARRYKDLSRKDLPRSYMGGEP